MARSRPDEIQAGDVVNVDVTFEGDGWHLVAATVLHTPCAEGDSWQFRLADGRLVYLQRFAAMTLVAKGTPVA